MINVIEPRDERCCASCFFFEPFPERPERGRCFRNPPVPVMAPEQSVVTGQVGIAVKNMRPPIEGSDRACGEYQHHG